MRDSIMILVGVIVGVALRLFSDWIHEGYSCRQFKKTIQELEDLDRKHGIRVELPKFKRDDWDHEQYPKPPIFLKCVDGTILEDGMIYPPASKPKPRNSDAPASPLSGD